MNICCVGFPLLCLRRSDNCFT